ncbi:phasin family protein [Anderseniella sp. Alg231-50]|uniref:phasin family protein n=1 Tax=Anderseniella sp. Alg231-50 TaxID=1922226 RepID=UPI000D55A181
MKQKTTTSSAPQAAIDAAGELPRTAMDFAGRYSADAIKTLSSCQGKYAAFMKQRLSEDFAMPQRLSGCKTPMEIMDVWADFYSTAMNNYMDHARNMAETGTEAVEEFVREVEVEAEEMAETTSKVLKAANANDDDTKAA